MKRVKSVGYPIFKPITPATIKNNQANRLIGSSFPFKPTAFLPLSKKSEISRSLLSPAHIFQVKGEKGGTPAKDQVSRSISSSRVKVFSRWGSSSRTMASMRFFFFSMMADIFSSRVPVVTNLKT